MSNTTGFSPRAGFVRRLLRDWTAVGAGCALLVIVLACAAAPLYASHIAGTDPFVSNIEGSVTRNGRAAAVLAQNTAGLGLGSTPIGPGWSGAYLLGADGEGRDVAARLLYGGRTSLLIAAAATALTLAAAGVLGVLAGAAGGWVDGVLRWLLDLVWAFPVFLLAISLAAVLASSGLRLGPVTVAADSLVLPMVILGVVFVPYVARPVRAQVLSLNRTDFVTAAMALGGTPGHIVRRHVLPPVGATLLLFAPTVLAFDLLTEASLSVLGVGVQSPAASWGTLIADGQSLIYTRPVVAIAPGLAVVATVLALNLLADSVRKAAAIRSGAR
jgi:peptide/nickel transport system permease protein